MKLINTIKCFFGYHDWRPVYPDSPTPVPPEGGMVCYSELHYCTRCQKAEHLGMGCIV